MIIPGISAEQLQWIGKLSVTATGFQVNSTDVTFAKGPATAIAPPYANKFLMTQSFAEVILAKNDIAKLTQHYVEVIA